MNALSFIKSLLTTLFSENTLVHEVIKTYIVEEILFLQITF